MIRLVRDPEPRELREARDKHLEDLRGLIRAGREIKSTDIHGYGLPAVRDTLHAQQHGKCCYCEVGVEPTHFPVEHYRPKSRVAKDGPTPARPGYWWLAHSWDNLLYSCGVCNGEKGTKFPLLAGSSPLKSESEEQPPGAERPALLNPYDGDATCDPLDLIEFRPTKGRREGTWEPFPRRGDKRAWHTIEDVLKLNRDGLLRYYREHVKDRVTPNTDAVNLALSGEELKRGDCRPLWRAFFRAARRLLSPASPFSALSYDALRHLVPDARLIPHLRMGWPRPPFTLKPMTPRPNAPDMGRPRTR